MTEKISRREVVASLAKGSVVAAAATSAGFSAESRAASATEKYTVSFDIHQHLESQNDNYTPFETAALIAKDFDLRTRIMDDNGIEKSIILLGTNYRRTNGIEDTKRVNDLVAAYVSKHSDRFPVGAGTVEVTHGDASLKELDRCANELKLRGIVWHHAHSGVHINHPFMRPILKRMQDLRLIPFIHIASPPFESTWMIEELAEEFPAITFVALGGLAARNTMEESIRMARKRKNILFDTSVVIHAKEISIETHIQRMGSDRMVFGSDIHAWPSIGQIPKLTSNMINESGGEINPHASITDDQKADILGRNAMRLLGLSDDGPR